MDRLFAFAYTDRRARLWSYVVSGFLAIVCGVVCRSIFHWNETATLLLIAAVTCGACLLFVVYYVSFDSSQPPEPADGDAHVLRNSIVVFAVLIVGGFVLRERDTLVADAQTFVVEYRLSNLDKSAEKAFRLTSPEQEQVQLQNEFRRAEAIADISYRYHVPVDPDAVMRAESTVLRSAAQPTVSAETRAVGLAASSALDEVAAVRAPQTVDVSRQTKYIQGEPGKQRSIIEFVPGGDLALGYSSVVIDNLDFRGARPFIGSITVIYPNSTVIIRNDTLENLDQTLDRITWVNAHFEHSKISVGGDPFVLVNVTFTDCDLTPLEGDPIGSRLVDAIAQANGQPVNFVSRGR